MILVVGRQVLGLHIIVMSVCRDINVLKMPVVTKNCLSQFLEQSRTGRHSAVTNLYKNIPEHSNPYVIYSD